MPSRRNVLKLGVFGALGLSGLGLWAAQRGASSPHIALSDDALIRLLEHTEHEQTLARLAEHITSGLDAKRLLGALFRAASHNVVPRSDFSKPHHILLCIQAMHKAQSYLPSRLAHHPGLWAADYFKGAQAEASGTASLDELEVTDLPHASRAALVFREAMEAFDGARAEAAVVSMHRAGARELIVESLLRYGSKDLRHIGHKAIHVAQGLATLELVGWQHAQEPLRSMGLTLALHYDEEGRDPDRAWVHNQGQIRKLERAWQNGPHSRDAIVQLLTTFRAADPCDASDEVVAWLTRGVATQSVWDAMFLSSAELMLNNPKSVEALHAVTASNAARTAFDASKSDETRRLLLLQNAARVADFHQYVAYWAVKRKKPAELAVRIEELEPRSLEATPSEALEELFAHFGSTADATLVGAQKTLGYLTQGSAGARLLGGRAMEMALSRATDTHDFKLPIAALEDSARISPSFRAPYLAACTARFRGSSEPQSELWKRIESLRLQVT